MSNRRVVVTGIGLVSSLGIGTDANWKALIAGHVRRDTCHQVRRHRLRDADRGRGQRVRSAQVHREERGQEDGHLHPVRHRGVTVRDGRLEARRHRRERPGRRCVHRIGDRRLHHDRTGAQGAARRRPAEDLAFLHPVGDHQPRGGPGVDPVRRERAEPGDLHRLLGVGACHRRGLRDHPARRRDRDDCWRLRSGDHPDGHRRLRRAARALHT